MKSTLQSEFCLFVCLFECELLACDLLLSLELKLIMLIVSLCRDSNTLFRGNSLASKVIDEFMKHVGKLYLQRTLQGCIDEVRKVGKGTSSDKAVLLV